jgi:peptide/nickel transport system ATP-binding protein
MTNELLSIVNLHKTFSVKAGLGTTAHATAVDGVTLSIARGEALGLVGESGCGKSTLGRLALRLLEPTSGSVFFEGRDLGALNREELRALRRSMQIIFQDPFASLNPRMRIREIITEPLVIHGLAKESELEERGAALLEKVGLSPDALPRYPHEFSGGQRQRVGIARALASGPAFIVADEPVSALDVSVQAQILNLMLRLQDQLGLTYLFVAHDLSVVKHVSDRVAVMYVGKLVEMAPTAPLFATPKHPYTEALMSAVPKPDPRLRSQRIVLEGEVADPANPPSGCYFHPRCRYAQEACRTETPALEEIQPGHFVSCHRARELALRGVDAIPQARGGPAGRTGGFTG